MPERKKLSLTEVLSEFTKVASEEVPAEAEDSVVEDAAVETEVEPDIVKTAEEDTEAEEHVAPSDADALRTLAKEAAESHTQSMQKEAELFGQIFASAVLDEFEKNAQIEKAEAGAYSAAMEKLAMDAITPELVKVAEEAYALCLTKLAFDAGYMAVPQGGMEGVMADQDLISAEEAAAGPQEVIPTEEDSPFIPEAEPEVVELPEQEEPAAQDNGTLETATEAVQDAAQAARAAAEAAKSAVEAAAGDAPAEEPVEVIEASPEELEDPEAELPVEEAELPEELPEELPAELAENLPKVAHEAYMATKEFLEKKAAELADESDSAEETQE